MSTTLQDIDTPHGPARVHLHHADAPVAALVLGHGAGGSVTAPDLVAVTAVALGARVSVALVEQPYRVAGRRSPAPARQLDAAWTAVREQLAAGPLAGLDHIAGGRSSGARVACRTATITGAVAVLCLAFPLHPPGRKPDAEQKTRLPELEAVTVPTLIVQGDRDPFGMPPPSATRTVVAVPGDHRLAKDLAAVSRAVGEWLAVVLPP
ncbi:MAG: Alpha/beta hydrolase family protein [Solirubrobacterales bacterium]|nr:Alpha/beta hydrolase family protein [Solirubrobacterales bacterium]